MELLGHDGGRVINRTIHELDCGRYDTVVTDYNLLLGQLIDILELEKRKSILSEFFGLNNRHTWKCPRALELEGVLVRRVVNSDLHVGAVELQKFRFETHAHVGRLVRSDNGRFRCDFETFALTIYSSTNREVSSARYLVGVRELESLCLRCHVA